MSIQSINMEINEEKETQTEDVIPVAVQSSILNGL